jgi:hypothetical protein
MSKNKHENRHPLERDSKAIRLFTKVKHKGKFIKNNRVDPRLDKQDEAKHESHLEQLNRDAVKFLHLHPEVERKEYGFDLSGGKGLHPDYYMGG